MSSLEKAIKLAIEAHKGQVDKGGRPYIEHCLNVMGQVKGYGEEIQIVAVLHDILEDTDIIVDDLRNAGFSEDIIEAILILTKNHDDSYGAYIDKIGTNFLANIVKMADLNHNLDISRMSKPYQVKDVERMLKYKKALLNLIENSWLNVRQVTSELSEPQINSIITSIQAV